MVKAVKAKRGFTATTRRQAKKGVVKPGASKPPLDAVEALIKQSAALSMEQTKTKASAKSKKTKTNRSAVRKQRKVKVASVRRKQKRKGIAR